MPPLSNFSICTCFETDFQVVWGVFDASYENIGSVLQLSISTNGLKLKGISLLRRNEAVVVPKIKRN